MVYEEFLIKYAEIGIKGKNRYVFEDALVRQIRQAVKPLLGEFTVFKTNGRIYLKASGYDYEDLIEALQRVFGIAYICPMVRVDDPAFENIADAASAYLKEVVPEGCTFKVEARRSVKSYPMHSMELAAALGEVILQRVPGMRVDVHHPVVTLHVEVREGGVSLYAKEIPGPGGMPVGSNGKSMLLLSGGIDSPVAGYMIAKRGVKIDAVYFHAPPYTSERAKQKVVDLACQVARYAGPIPLSVVNFTDIQLAIYEKCPHDQLTIIMRRMMMRIAERIAENSGCLGLITGESIGQVASQTIPSLTATNEVCAMPVFRPLIGFDKNEIIDVAQKIGTFETSIQPYEDCCTIFVAKHPVTKPNLKSIRKSETHLDDVIEEMLDKAVETAEVIWCEPAP